MKIYCMSDIHGHLAEFEYALSLVEEQLPQADTKLLLLGDYIHDGPDSYGVLKKIMELQYKWGQDKVIALMGNHEEMVVEGREPISFDPEERERYEAGEDDFLSWMENLPRYYTEGKTIFVHAGIEEEAEDMWEWGTDDYIFTEKYPASIGKFYGDYKIVAGHVGTSQIAGDMGFHDIYYDGEAHYYIDGTVKLSGWIPVLMVDTQKNKYYRVTESGPWLILPYEEEN